MTDPSWWNPGASGPGQTQPIPQHPTQPIGRPTGRVQDGRYQGAQHPGRPAGRRRGRGWTALLVVLACFALLAVAADRGADLLAERAVGQGVQREQGLAAPADVSIAGFPFLTQLLSGRYRQIDLAADGVQAGSGLTVDRVTVRLTDVSAGASDLLAGRTDRLRAGAVSVRARVGYASLDRVFADRLGTDQLAVTFADGGRNRLAVTGTLRTVLGDLQVKGLVSARLVEQGIRLRLVPGSVPGLPPVADRLLQDLFDLTLPLPAQVSGIRPTTVEIGPDGVTLTGTGTDIPLGRLAR